MRSTVRTLGIEIVRGCNFKCRMCPVTANSPDVKYMDLSLLQRIVDAAEGLGQLKALWFFNFGEPLLHPQFRRCLEIAYKSEVLRQAFVIVHTNASELSGDIADAILEIPLINKLAFSFDGFGDEKSFTQLRGEHYNKVLNNIRAFAARAKVIRPDLQLTTCTILPTHSPPPPRKTDTILHEIFEPMGIKVETREMHNYSGNEMLELSGGQDKPVFGGCNFIEEDSLYFTVDGLAMACCAVFDQRFNIGSINDTNEMDDLLNNDKARYIKHHTRMDNRGAVEQCKNCTLSIGGYAGREAAAAFWADKINSGEVVCPEEFTYIQKNIIRQRGRKMFIHFVYELHYGNPLYFTWIFELALHFAKKDGGVVIAQQKYFDWLRDKEEVPPVTDGAYGHKSSNPSDLGVTRHYEIPGHIDERILSEQGSRLKAWAHMMTENYELMEEFLEKTIGEITASDAVEGIILWYPFPSINKAARVRGIPLLYIDTAPLRTPIYKTAAYLDFEGTNLAGNEAAKRYKIFQKELASGDILSENILSPKEILAVFLSDQYLSMLETLESTPVYEWGVALSPDISYILAFNSMYLQSEFLSYIKHCIDAAKALIRHHPGDDFTVKKTTWPGDVDESPDAESFIVKCRRIVCSGSKIAFLAMLWGRLVHIIGSPHTSFVRGAAQTLSSEDSRPADDKFVSFIAFGYFVPFEWLFDHDYLLWRLTRPSEAEIYTKHLNYYLIQMGVDTSEFLSVPKEERFDFLLRCRYAALSGSQIVGHLFQRLKDDDKISAAEAEAKIKSLIAPQPVSELGFSGHIDHPAPDYGVDGASVWVEGWVHHGAGICRVDATLGDQASGRLVYGLPRHGIDDVLPELGTIYVGYGGWLDTGGMTRGVHLLKLRYLAANGEEFFSEREVNLL